MKRLLVLIMLLLILALPTFAQEATPEATETAAAQNARDYCAGQVTYTLPDGWAEGAVTRNSASVSRLIASSKDTLNKYATLLDADESSVIIGVFDRKAFADLLHLDADADISDLLRTLVAQPGSVNFTMSEVAALTLGDHPAAQVSGTSDAEIQDAVFVAFDSDTLGMVLLSANPKAQTRWNDTALALAESLSADDVPRFAQENGSLPLTQSFPSSDCSVGFGIPEGFTATKLSADGARIFKVWMTNYDTPGAESGNLLDSGQARLELEITNAAQIKGDLAYYIDQVSQHISGKDGTPSEATIGEQKALLTEVQVTDFDKHIGDALIMAIQDKDGSIATLTVYAAPDELDQWRATALAVATSLWVQLPSSN